MKLEAGKKYELNNGDVHIASYNEYSRFYDLGGFSYDESGEWVGMEGLTYPLHVKRCVSPTLIPGNTYTARNGGKWECIFVRDGKACLIVTGKPPRS